MHVKSTGTQEQTHIVQLEKLKFMNHLSTKICWLWIFSMKLNLKQKYVQVRKFNFIKVTFFLLKRLESLEEEVISHRIRLVIVDSIASLVRKEFSSSAGSSLVQRTNFLSRQAALLKYIAEVFRIPVSKRT